MGKYLGLRPGATLDGVKPESLEVKMFDLQEFE